MKMETFLVFNVQTIAYGYEVKANNDKEATEKLQDYLSGCISKDVEAIDNNMVLDNFFQSEGKT